MIECEDTAFQVINIPIFEYEVGPNVSRRLNSALKDFFSVAIGYNNRRHAFSKTILPGHFGFNLIVCQKLEINYRKAVYLLVTRHQINPTL